MVSPECAPFAETGGLGHMVSGLTKALANRHHDVRLFLPLYGFIHPHNDWFCHRDIPVYMGQKVETCQVYEASQNGITFYFIDAPNYFKDAAIYVDGPYNGERFAFFCRAVLDSCNTLQWTPEVIHCHDWATGLIPVYCNTLRSCHPISSAATVFTIHNLQYQGIFAPSILSFAGIPFSEFHSTSLEALGQVNLLKGALYHATKITTVSPRYAQEIQTTEFGCGLDHVLRFKAGDLIGILNGIDTDVWNPETDPLIPSHFTSNNLSPKEECKKSIRNQFHLPHTPAPLLGVVSRICWQKGLDVFANVLPYLLNNTQLQVIILGTGDRNLENQFRSLEQPFPNQVRMIPQYDSELAHRLQAGCDLFILPSRYEPCGLAQLYAMRYGTLPIVRATGGLADTVQSLNESDETGYGFVFSDLHNDAIYNTVHWAYRIYNEKHNLFQKMQKTAMEADFSWARSSAQYESVYQWAFNQRG